MTSDYDLIAVGGGLAGSALARSMAGAGKRVLVVEGEKEFRDRVRGEQIVSWGVGEMRELGIYDLLTSSCAHELIWWDLYIGPILTGHRDVSQTTPQQCANLTFYHASMQERLLEAAAAAGAEVMRGARVRNVAPGQPATVTVDRNGSEERLTARIVAGCDGRNSNVRRWGGFPASRTPTAASSPGCSSKTSPRRTTSRSDWIRRPARVPSCSPRAVDGHAPTWRSA